jgi:mRNA interferase RelE/StbE
MGYQIVILRRAQRELGRLPHPEYERVRDTIRALAAEPWPASCLRLTDHEGWRIRIGDYRVLYEINDRERVITVVHVGHRRDVYR